MKLFVKCIVLPVCIVVTLITILPAQDIRSSLLQNLKSNNVYTRYTSLLLLSNLAITDKAYAELIQLSKNSDDSVIRLASLYTLSKRTQEKTFTDDFIKSYPSGEQQTILWKYQEKSDYINLSSPLQDYLGYLSFTNDIALEKLISGIPYSDGRHGDSLYSLVCGVYKTDPERVIFFFNKHQIDNADFLSICKESSNG